MMYSVPKLKPNSMMAAVAFPGRDGRAHEPSYPQIQACNGYHSLLVPSQSITTDHRASLQTRSKEPLKSHWAHSLRILFL